MVGKERGFSLIELLVVIAIIAILAAILFPIFIGAKERGRQASCCANLKQLTHALFMYADDHDGYLPMGSSRYFYWYGVDRPKEWSGAPYTYTGILPPINVAEGSLWPYVKNKAVYECPSDKGLPMWIDGNKVPNFGLSYSMNWVLGIISLSDRPPRTVHLSSATAGRSGKILMLIHEYRGDSTTNGINDGFYTWPGDKYAKIHWDGTTCSYADGHVRWISNKQMETHIAKGDWYRNDQQGH